MAILNTEALRGQFILEDEERQPFTLDKGDHRGRRRTPNKNALNLNDADILHLTWQANSDRDSYSTAPRKEIEGVTDTSKIHTDHVIECQMMKAVYNQADLGTTRRSQKLLKQVVQIHNQPLLNFNRTDLLINKSIKEDALKDRGDGFTGCYLSNRLEGRFVSDFLETSVVRVFDHPERFQGNYLLQFGTKAAGVQGPTRRPHLVRNICTKMKSSGERMHARFAEAQDEAAGFEGLEHKFAHMLEKAFDDKEFVTRMDNRSRFARQQKTKKDDARVDGGSGGKKGGVRAAATSTTKSQAPKAPSIAATKETALPAPPPVNPVEKAKKKKKGVGAAAPSTTKTNMPKAPAKSAAKQKTPRAAPAAPP